MANRFYAHSRAGRPPETWQPLVLSSAKKTTGQFVCNPIRYRLEFLHNY